MAFLQKIFKRLFLIFQFTLVFIYILFEEIIWEEIALPVYQKIQSFRILQTLQSKINTSPRYLILVLFLIMLLGVEVAGLLAGMLFVEGKVWLGIVLYITKIPITAITFWLFRVAKEKLLSFGWFAWGYYKLMNILEWLKEREVYQSSMEVVKKSKEKSKYSLRLIKVRYFSQESKFINDLKRFYRYIKNLRNRKNG